MQKINVKNILIIMLIAIEVIATYFMYKSGTNKEVVLDNVELKELTDNNSFAIYLDGEEYNQTTWPESAEFQKAECQNEKGDIVNGILTFNEEENKAYVKNITQTTYCYLYFKSCNGPVGTVLADKAQVSPCEIGGMYRYQGTNDVNNYICFGTTDQTTCTSNADKYMYRIIGVTPEGELKLIKETVIKEESTIAFQWNDKYKITDCESDGSGCTWANSKLYNRLNGLCESDNINCSGTISGTYGDSNIFIGNSYYEYLTNGSVWLDKISNHRWKYGESKKLDSYNGDNAYSIESQFSNSIDEAKIGLQYIHDYYYAYPGGNPGSGTNAKNAWIHLSKNGNSEISYEWLISKYGVIRTDVIAWAVYSGGTLNGNSLNFDNGVRPVFYLTPGVTFKSGTTGEKTNPYILNVVDDSPAPTCSFNVTNSGVTLQHSNAASWYMSTSQTSSPSYGTGIATSALGEHTYYGYVKNSNGTTGTCQLEMYKATQNACYQTGSSDGGYTNCTGTYMLGAYTPTEGTTGKCFLSHESSNIYNNCSAPCDVISSGLGTIPSSKPTCPNGYYTLDSCTCSCQSVTTYTCSNGSSCTTSGCCSQMFCGSDNCKSGYTEINPDTYTRYCYK